MDDLPDRLTAPTLPDEVAAIRNEARALGALGDEKAAEAVLTAGMQRFPRHPGLIQDHAEIAERRGDTKAALHRWETMRRRMPGQPQASLGAARAFRDAGRLQDAVRVMDEAAARFPANFFVLTACADLAMEQRDWRRAAELTEVLRARFPHHPRGYVDGGTALRHLHRTDEADRVTEAGLARYRGHLQLLVNHARTAMQRPDWAQAERRWRDVQASHPKAAVGYIGLAEMFRLRAQHAAGEDVLRTGLKVLPGHPALLAQFAVSATQRGAWAEAAERWRGYALRFPQKGVGHHQLGLALKQLGLAEAADRALAAGTELAPDHLALALEWALCAQAANDWAEAVRRWQTLDVRFPGTLEVQEGLLQARLGAAECGIAVPDDAAWPAPGQAGPSDEASTPEEILSQFEGLGENCEFGLVQRHYGLEPISLLRWVSISIAGLIHSLEDGLQDVGNPAHTSLVVHPPAEEYFVRDSFYRFGMHTFVKKGSMPEQRFYEQQCRRLRFLGRKLREDLELGERIFVHFRKEETSAAQLQKLHAAVRRHGTATLLFVRLCDAAHKPGTVEVADTGLLIGYIDRFGKIPPVGWNIAFDTWLEICRKALDLKRKLAAIGPALP